MDQPRRCPHCSTDNRRDRRFCLHCGTNLELRCARCGLVQWVDEETCGRCGAMLWADGRPCEWAADPLLAKGHGRLSVEEILRATNRPVTIVKADLSGFTAMSERIGDPEVVTAIMNRVFEPLVAIINELGGHVDNYAGDMVIAFFGVPTAVDRAAERAVMAALRMREAIDRLNDERVAGEVQLGISTGVATGVGLWTSVGFGAGAKQTLTGELGDYAAELEKVADRGQVAICPDTWLEVRGAIACERSPATVRAPGAARAGEVYLATALPAEFDWFAEQEACALPWHGPTDTLEDLRAVWRQGGMFALCGQRGIGTSRTLYDFARWVEAQRVRVAVVATDFLAGPPSLPDRKLDTLIIDNLDCWPERPDDEALAKAARLVVAGARHRPSEAWQDVDIWNLDRDDCDGLARSIAGGHAHRRALEWLWQWTDGLPLAVRELAPQMSRVNRQPFWEQPPRPLSARLVEARAAAIDACTPVEQAVLLVVAAITDPETLVFEYETLRAAFGGADVRAALAGLDLASLLLDVPDCAFLERLTYQIALDRLTDSVRQKLREG